MPLEVMLDSGAFGAWKRGIELPLADYIKFCKRHKDKVFAYVNMDVLPGFKGVFIHTREAVEASASASYDNLRRMRDAGLRPIPVFHQGEDWSWLHRLVDDGEDYIGISPYAKANQAQIRTWLDQCFTILTVDGKPIVRTHGFGMTSPKLTVRYPWGSSDSTTWAINYGTLMVPRQRHDGTADYSRPITIHVSGDSPNASRQFGSFHDNQKNWVKFWLKSIGMDIEDVVNDNRARMLAYIYYFLKLEEQAQSSVYRGEGLSLFSGAQAQPKKHIDLTYKLLFATATRHMHPQAALLQQAGADRRLVSYFDERLDEEGFCNYLANPVVPLKKRRTKLNYENKTYLTQRAVALIKRIKQYEEMDPDVDL